MALKIIWTQTAWNDLEDAADFIAKDSRHLFKKYEMLPAL